VREAADGAEVAVVHRPKYGDWSLPKGKLDEGESFEDAALREVREETGLECELGEELEPARYTDRRGRDKLVRFWLMRPTGGDFVPSDEVDELRWLAPAEAVKLLDYDHDRALVNALK
jgi:8-oxo-dGTP diphosphatase